MDNPMVERFIQPRAVVTNFLVGRAVLCAPLPVKMRVGAHGVTRPTFPCAKQRDLNSRAPQNFESFSRMLRIRINGADNDPFYSRRLDGVGAVRGASARNARFERDINRRAARI